MKKLFLPILFTTLIHYLQAQSPAERRCAAFQKGQNISNWLEATWQTGWPTPNGYSKSDLQLMKDAGITSIRLPAGFSEITDTLAPYNVALNHPLFERIDSVIKWCDELQLNLIIDNHHGWPLTDQNWRNHLVRFSHLWGTLANRYKNLDPETYTFELLNEPAIGFTVDSLNVMFNAAIDSIRKHTAQHSIIVSPSFGSWGVTYNTYLPLQDTNLIYTFHCYDPLNFTHQGFSWGNPAFPAGIVYPDGNNLFETVLYQGWDAVANWRNQYNKPVFLGEFGVSHYADAVSKCTWIEFMGSKILQTNMPWFYWDWQYDFSMFNGTVPSEDSVLPCFKRALRLYGDSSFTSVENELSAELKNVLLYPNIIGRGEISHLLLPAVENYEVKVMDAGGRNVFDNRFYGSQIEIPATLERGIYFVRISTNDKAATKKLVVY